MTDAGFLLRLAEQNLAHDDREATLTCLKQALAQPLTPPDREALGQLAQHLIEAGGPTAETARWVAARAQGLEVGGAPAPAATPQEAEGSQTLDAVQRLWSTASSGPAPSIPVAEVIARLLTTDLDLGTTAALALELVAEATAATRAHLILAEASYGLGQGPAKPPETSRGVIEEVRRTRAPVRVDDAQEDPRFGGRESVRELGLSSVLCVPVLAEDELIGVIYLGAAPGCRFSAADQVLCQTLAGLVAGPLRAGARFKAQGEALERTRRSLRRDREETLRRQGGPVLVGRSPALRELQAAIERFAPGSHPILIQGESGTGKELVARALHAHSDRADGPFEAQNMAALAPTLAESLLYGHAKGAFSGAERARPGLFRLAHTGTLLLDELGELDLELQAKLLRVLQEGEVRPVGGNAVERVDVRVIAATHRDLLAEVRAGRFREDLYYRLNVISLRVPPLRERATDVPLLLEHFLTEQAAELDLSLPELPAELFERLEAYAWPGNVRQLQSYATQLLLAGPHAALPDGPRPPRDPDGDRLTVEVHLHGDEPYALRDARQVFDAAFLEQVLSHGQPLGKVAKALGIHRSYLSQLIKKYGISRS